MAQYVSLERVLSNCACDSSALQVWCHGKFNLVQRWVVAKRSGLYLLCVSPAFLLLDLGLLIWWKTSLWVVGVFFVLNQF